MNTIEPLSPLNGSHHPNGFARGTSAEEVARRLGGKKARRSGKNWVTCCPAHDDQNPSLSLSEGDNGQLLFHCHAGCSQQAVIAALKREGINVGRQSNDGADDDRSGNIAALKLKGFQTTATYDYCDGSGALLYKNVRLERRSPSGKRIEKAFRQRRPNPNGQGYIENLNGIDRVPYHLPELLNRAGEDVHVTEGEKDANALAKLGLLSTSIAAPNLTNLEFLRDRHVYIHEDNDETGRRKAKSLADKLLDIAASIQFVRYPDAGIGGDVSNWLDQDKSRGLAEILQRCDESELFAASQAHQTGEADDEEEPLPLYRSLPAADPFPIEALGALEAAARALQAQTQAPIDIAANSVLATCSLACQPHADIELPTGEAKPLSLYIVTVASSGERKTSNDARALVPVKEREEELRRCYEKEIQSYLYADVWKADRNKTIRNGKLNRHKKREALAELGEEPKGPLTPILVCHEPTIEGLAKMLVDGQPSVGVFASEGGAFIGGHGFTDDAKLRTASNFSMLWDDGALTRVRAGDGVTVLAGRRVALHLQAQPDVATRFLGDRILIDQGLLSRVLVSAPESTQGHRFFRKPEVGHNSAMADYCARVQSLLKRPMPLKEGTRNELSPRRLRLSSEAELMWIAFSDEVEAKLAPGREYQPISGFAAKLPEHAARLAGVLTVYRDPDAKEVDGETMANGITLARHYARNRLRLHGATLLNAELLKAEELLEWLCGKWHAEHGAIISLPEIVRLGPNSIRETGTARRLTVMLEQHGYLKKLDKPAEVMGKKRREVWQIKYRNFDACPTEPAKHAEPEPTSAISAAPPWEIDNGDPQLSQVPQLPQGRRRPDEGGDRRQATVSASDLCGAPDGQGGAQ